MAKFVAYIKQAGDGCDYTIACGYKLVHLKSDNYDDAMLEIRKLLGEDGQEDAYTGDIALESVRLIEVANSWKVDVAKIYGEIAAVEKTRKDEAKRLRDYNEYQRLKNQFEK